MVKVRAIRSMLCSYGLLKYTAVYVIFEGQKLRGQLIKRTQESKSVSIIFLSQIQCQLTSRTLLLGKSPMLFLSLLNNIQQDGIDELKALKTLYEKFSFLMTVF